MRIVASDRIKQLEQLYKTGVIDRYKFQDALALLHFAGMIDLETYATLNDEAIADSIAALDEQ